MDAYHLSYHKRFKCSSPFRQMIKSLEEPRCIVDSSGAEWCNYFCDNYIKIDAKVPDENLCANLKFKGPGYLNYSKVQSRKFLLVLINQSKIS